MEYECPALKVDPLRSRQPRKFAALSSKINLSNYVLDGLTVHEGEVFHIPA